MQQSTKDLQDELSGYAGTDGTLKSMEDLINVATLYLSGEDIVKASDGLEKVKEDVVLEETSNAFQNLYNALHQAIAPQIVESCYEQGYDAYTAKNYEEAANLLGRVIKYDEMNGNAFYYYAQSCRQLERNDEAIMAYKKVLELVPADTERAKTARNHLNRLEAN